MSIADSLSRSVRDGSRLLASVAEFYLHGAVLHPWGSRYWAWRYQKNDPWSYAKSPYERIKYERTMAILPSAPTVDGIHEKALEVGCSEGVFTNMLARSGRVKQVVGVDVAEAAVARATERCTGLANVELLHGDVRSVSLSPPFSLVLCAETLSHMGSWANLRAMAETLVGMLQVGGSLVLVDSHPKALFLHRPFRKHPKLSVVETQVHDDPFRPYMITVLSRRA
jgi:2-polyprenyl-3-methyl-5-hydroxy-6-metoxy-1,4-benzoquinol methylase